MEPTAPGSSVGAAQHGLGASWGWWAPCCCVLILYGPSGPSEIRHRRRWLDLACGPSVCVPGALGVTWESGCKAALLHSYVGGASAGSLNLHCAQGTVGSRPARGRCRPPPVCVPCAGGSPLLRGTAMCSAPSTLQATRLLDQDADGWAVDSREGGGCKLPARALLPGAGGGAADAPPWGHGVAVTGCGSRCVARVLCSALSLPAVLPVGL